MEHLKKTITQLRIRIWLISFGLQMLVLAGSFWFWRDEMLTRPTLTGLAVLGCAFTSLIIAYVSGSYMQTLLKAFGDAILHISPKGNAEAPIADKLTIGKEYVSSMIYHLYQIASAPTDKILDEHRREATQASNILSKLPLPLFVFNSEQMTTFASDAALEYTKTESAALLGKPIFESIDLEFSTPFTLKSWADTCQKDKATDVAYWQRVRVRVEGDEDSVQQCDIAAYYNRDNPTGTEFIVTFFDRTQEYAKDDQSLSFIALAVHELRTPLTFIRGYIEALDEDLEGKLDKETSVYMTRLRSAAQQLTVFVNNILNVARIEQNQLTVTLAEVQWSEIIKHVSEDMQLRARSLGVEIEYDIAKDLPSVAADRITIYEVLCNLIDNALKYSGTSKKIVIKSYLNKENLVETTVTDQGVGIPANVLPSLFEKFHRNFRNRSEVSGTGLGLYLSKTIIGAHGGNIWIKSKDGEGTTVGITVQLYSSLANKQKSNDNDAGMVRTAHGWIKNHSLYRR
ncbi:MAG: HAMP domain-containing sensor histidine kinase [Candidatus Saccharimonadales bacterium]